MYTIGNIIVGTHLPWSDEAYNAVKIAYARHLFETDRKRFRELVTEGCEDDLADMTDEELLAGIVDSTDEFDFEEIFEDEWTTLYHGGSDWSPMYVGVEIEGFDDTDHFPLESLCNVRPSHEQKARAKEKYDRLPESVRRLLPPFDVYVVWSSS